MLGILQRYVIDQVLRSFALALLTITGIFVLFMVMAEAARQGLAPSDIIRIVPYIIPSSLPYTIPVALLFAVSVVYGRMAGDNEVVAIKTAGLSAWFVLLPTMLLGLSLSVLLFWLSSDAIPRASSEFRSILLRDVEDMFYKVLKKEGQFVMRGSPFFVAVRDVQDRTLIDATFKHRRSKNEPNVFDLEVFAKKAWIYILKDEGKIRVELEDSETTGNSTERPFLFYINGKRFLEWPIPDDKDKKPEDKKIQMMTNREMTQEQAELLHKIHFERARQAVAAAMWIGSGRLGRVNWADVGGAFDAFRKWDRRYKELETEKYLRVALAAGSLFFVFLGAPVGILFARRDFLSSFMVCFLPIILVYYPLTLAGVNMSKENLVWPAIVFAGNFVLGLLAGPVWRKVRRH